VAFDLWESVNVHYEDPHERWAVHEGNLTQLRYLRSNKGSYKFTGLTWLDGCLPMHDDRSNTTIRLALGTESKYLASSRERPWTRILDRSAHLGRLPERREYVDVVTASKAVLRGKSATIAHQQMYRLLVQTYSTPCRACWCRHSIRKPEYV
jgi:hypothetical protein